MKDENNANEIWFENASQNFEEACVNGDWPIARAILADIEEKGFPTIALRRYMNLEMGKTDDVEFVPYTHPTPPTIKPSEMDETVRINLIGCTAPLCKDPSHD